MSLHDLTPMFIGYVVSLVLLVVGSVIVLGVSFFADVEGDTEDEKGQ